MAQGVKEDMRILGAKRVEVVRSTQDVVLTPEQKRRIAHLPLKPVEFKR